MLTTRGMKTTFDQIKDKNDWRKGVIKVMDNPGLKRRKEIEQAVEHYTKSKVTWEPVSRGRIRMIYPDSIQTTSYLIL